MVDLNELSDDVKDDVIFHSMRMLTCLTKAYGAEIGQQMFENLVEFLGPSISGEVWMHLIAGKTGRKISVTSNPISNPIPNKINLIKTIREFTHESLLDAKNDSDRICSGYYVEYRLDTFETARLFQKALNGVGAIVS
jgi:hypothetical protein